uniref:Uncharacterized protein n=1 Tax=Avena sativa TaxID=4498 RepID=A0ACD5TIY0_AVESA
MNWQQFCELLLDRFPDAGAHESMDQFHQLKQYTTVNTYIDTFEEWMTLMKIDHHYLPEYLFTLRFISGLKDALKHAVKTHKPPDLRAAYWYARQEELALLSITKRQNTVTITNRQQNTQPTNRFPQNREQRNKPPMDRNKEKGKCWYCPEDWSFGHKCASIKSIVHAIEMQGHSDDEEGYEQEAVDIPQPLLLPQVSLQPEQVLQQPLQQPADNVMQLPLQAPHGMPGEGTLSVQLMIEGKPAVALIDTGSTNTFIDLQFAKQNQFRLLPVPHRKVMVTGGVELSCQYILPQCNYKLQDKDLTNDFHILPLQGYDVILGANWLKKFNPNLIDWENRTVSLFYHGSWITLVDKQ